jgi:bacteriocin biosynthesis cyclodehydratase domain-containing protein
MTAIRTSTRSWLVNTEARVLASGEDILIRYGGTVVRCAAPGIRQFVVSLLEKAVDGRVDLDAARMQTRQAARFEQLMAQLVAAGLFIELDADDATGHGLTSPVVLGLWQRGGGAVDRADIAARLRGRPVRLLGSGLLADDLRLALTGAGLTIGADDDLTAPAVVVGAHDHDPLLTEWNASRLADGVAAPWLAVVSFNGGQAVVGPWIVPGESACYECYLLRRAATFGVGALSPVLATATAEGPVFDSSARHPGPRLIQTGLVLDRVVEYVGLDGHGGQAIPGGLTTISMRADSVDVEHHRVLRVPRCTSCSPAANVGYPQVWFATGVEE